MAAPAQYVASIVIDSVIEALGAFLTPFVYGSTIIRGQVNRVAPPLGPFVLLQEILSVDLETPSATFNGTNSQVELNGPTRIDIQIDFYGPNSGDQCRAVKGVYRSIYSVAQFPAGIAPLYCTDGQQSPLITGEQQYESRWTLTASLQYNPSVYIPQQSASTIAMNIIEGF